MPSQPRRRPSSPPAPAPSTNGCCSSQHRESGPQFTDPGEAAPGKLGAGFSKRVQAQGGGQHRGKDSVCGILDRTGVLGRAQPIWQPQWNPRLHAVPFPDSHGLSGPELQVPSAPCVVPVCTGLDTPHSGAYLGTPPTRCGTPMAPAGRSGHAQGSGRSRKATNAAFSPRATGWRGPGCTGARGSTGPSTFTEETRPRPRRERPWLPHRRATPSGNPKTDRGKGQAPGFIQHQRVQYRQSRDSPIPRGVWGATPAQRLSSPPQAPDATGESGAPGSASDPAVCPHSTPLPGSGTGVRTPGGTEWEWGRGAAPRAPLGTHRSRMFCTRAHLGS